MDNRKKQAEEKQQLILEKKRMKEQLVGDRTPRIGDKMKLLARTTMLESTLI